MSVYDELNDCIESAWSSDSCEYEVYSEMFDLIAEAEYKYDNLKAENAKLRKLVSHLMYVKPAQVTAITHDGKLFRFDEKLAEVGMRFEAEND